MIMSVSTLLIFSGAATPARAVNCSIRVARERFARPRSWRVWRCPSRLVAMAPRLCGEIHAKKEQGDRAGAYQHDAPQQVEIDPGAAQDREPDPREDHPCDQAGCDQHGQRM